MEKEVRVLNNQNHFFKINLPHSRAYLKNVELAKYSEVHRPEWSYRDFVKDQVEKAKPDMFKKEIKERLKHQIRYTCP